MANKLLTLAGLKTAVEKSQAKDLVDSPLGKALKLYEYFDEDRINERRDALDDVIQAVPAAKKKATADRAVVKYLDDVLRAATTERKKIDTDLAKFGMHKVKVQVLLTNWDGDTMHNRQVFVVFKCPGAPDITLKKEVKGGELDFNNVELPPSGSIFVNAFPSNGSSDQARGTNTYNLPKRPLVQFKVKQKSHEIKTKAKSGLKATQKVGLKGTAGLNWKIVTIGGERTSEKELQKEFEEEVEFVFKVPEPGLEIEMAK